ncbi:MAG: sigma-70 family RNA polymerase sigma factor [Ginsengibacter sp.]|jgi:RNA polymerase sigma-70 factor (ECF subfamily)
MLDHKTEPLSDIDILEMVLTGQIQLYELIVKRYNAYLYKIGKTYGFCHQDVQDIMQETYVNAYRSLSKFKKEATFKTWITRIMLNNCYHKQQKIKIKKEVSTESMELLNKVPLTRETMSQSKTVNKELGEILEKAILDLPEKYKIVFTLRELNSLSILETSSALGISSGNVKIRLSRAKNLLRNEIEKMYSTQEIFELNLIYCNEIVENVMTAIRSINKVIQLK